MKARHALVSLALVVATSLVFAQDTPAPKPAEKLPDVFPLTPGSKWVYDEKRTGMGEKSEAEATVEILKKDKVKDLDCALMKVSYPDGRLIELAYAESKKGVQLVSKKITNEGKTQEVELPSPELFIRFPMKAGHRWRYAHFDATCTKEEEVTVPAGKFKAWRVEYDRADTEEGPRPICNIMGTAEQITIWFAPGTGIVKMSWTIMTPIEHADGPPVYTRELKKVEKK